MIKRIILFLLLFSTLMSGAFAAQCATNKNVEDNSLTCLLSNKNLQSFFSSMDWLNWVMFALTVVVLGNVLTRIPFFNNKAVAYFISFITTSTLIWLLLEDGIFPIHFVFWLLEFVIVGSLLFAVSLLVKSREGAEATSKTLITIGIITALFMANAYHSFVDEMSDTKPDVKKAVGEDTLLKQVVDFNIKIPGTLLLFVLLIIAVWSFLAKPVGAKSYEKSKDFWNKRNLWGSKKREMINKREEMLKNVVQTYKELVDARK